MSEPEKKPRRRVKKVKGHGGHHGGAWKVAYADFVTAMMALFLVLWLVSQADTKLKQSIANYFRSPGVFDSMHGGILAGPKKVSREPDKATSKDQDQALFDTAELLRKKFTTRPEFSAYKDQIQIDVTDEGLRIQILDKAERVSFSSGNADITPQARAILDEIARGICALPNPISIGGHTDRHTFPEGSTYTNWELSADRANAARRELQSACVRPEQIRRIVGFADTQLLIPEDPYAAGNRRISITVMRLSGQANESGDNNDFNGVPAGVGNENTNHSSHDGAQADANLKTTPATAPKPADKTSSHNEAHDNAKDATSGEASSNRNVNPSNSAKATTGGDAEKRLAQTKLANEGAIHVGTPDALPAGVTRTRERPAAHSLASSP